MDPNTESSSGVVALLLDDLAPPRLGTLLRAARKERGNTRREIAQRVGTTAGELRRYERGDEPVPPSVIAALAECYGEDLTDQLATRAPIEVDRRRLVVGTVAQPLESDEADELLGQYVGIVSRLRQSQPGEPIALRTDDLVALSNALGQDTELVEARIVELLGCTPHEAHSLHAEMLRRKLVLPVAGLVAGVAMVAGVGIAHAATNAPAGRAVTPPAATSQAATSHAATSHAAGPAVAVSHQAAHTDHGDTAKIAAAHITAAHLAAGHVVTAVDTPAPTTVVVKPSTPQATVARPIITPDTTPMSIPGNETVTIIQP